MTVLADVFRQQGEVCGKLGSPFMARLLPLIADNLSPGTAVMDKMLNWQGDVSNMGDSVPLRLAGGLHALVLQEQDPDLVAAYPPNSCEDAQLWTAIEAAFETHAAFLLDWLDSPPQTNEVRRAATLIATGAFLNEEFGLPLVLSEVGASGGLNLNFDRFALAFDGHWIGPANADVTLRPSWEGSVPRGSALRVTERRGCDLHPLTAPEDALRLLSYLWPDQPDRRALTKAALACPRATVDRADVGAWLPGRLANRTDGNVHLIYHTIAWQYLPAETKATCAAMIESAGRTARDTAPLAWFGMEADDVADGAALTLRLWPGDRRINLGRADFHGRWVRWDPKEL